MARRGLSAAYRIEADAAETPRLAEAPAPDEGEQHGERVSSRPLWLAMQQRNARLSGQVQVVHLRCLVLGFETLAIRRRQDSRWSGAPSVRPRHHLARQAMAAVSA
jgi:hypothetical protein